MTDLKLNEAVVDAVVAKLKNGWPARAAAINAATADDLAISAPRLAGGAALDGSDFYKSGYGSIPQAPACFVVEGPAEFTEEGAHGFIFMPMILVRVLEEAADRQQLATKLRRQARCVIEVLYDDAPREVLFEAGTQTILAHRIFPIEAAPGPTFRPENETDLFRSHYDVIFRVEQSEGD